MIQNTVIIKKDKKLQNIQKHNIKKLQRYNKKTLFRKRGQAIWDAGVEIGMIHCDHINSSEWATI